LPKTIQVAPGYHWPLQPTKFELAMAKNTNQSNGVSRLLRKNNTEQYATDNDWTNNPDEAKLFSDVLEAAAECARRGLHDVELTLRVETHACDFFCTRLD